MSSFNLEVKIRKPTRLITTAWERYVSVLGRRSRGKEFSDCYFDPYARAVMLEPEIDPSNWLHGKEGYSLGVYSGGTWTSAPDSWTEGEGPFGDAGHYVSFAGDSTYPATTPWAAYRSLTHAIPENYGVYFILHWVAPAGTFLPNLQFWPRVDTTKTVTVGGYEYHYAPLMFRIDSQTAHIAIYECESDSFDDWQDLMFTKTYQHPLNLDAGGISNLWFTLKVLPAIEKWDDEGTEETDYSHDFVLQSPQLRGGGFCYRTKIARSENSLFPEGVAGIRSLTGGMCTLAIAPIYYPASGYVISEEFCKREANTDYPTVEEESYIPSGASITHELVHPETYADIIGGETFQRFRIKSTLTPTVTGFGETPILYSVEPAIAGTAADRTQSEVDISADVSLTERMSDDLTGYQATVRLRNTEGTYNYLAYRPVNEITFSLGDVARAVLYTKDNAFQWYETPEHEALFLEWQAGDFWERLGWQHVAGMPDYGGESISDAVTDYFERLGFDTSNLHIASSLESIYLPHSPAKDDPLCKPQDGSKATEFIEDLREKFFSTYPTGMDGVGDFWIAEPLDPLDPSNIMRTYYLSRAQATAAEASDPCYCIEPHVTFKHELHRNEIWVIGMNPATKEPIVDYWIDAQSQTNEDWPYYVGERRLVIALTRLPALGYVTWYLRQLVKIFGYVRRHISFTTKYDPYIMPKDFIKFYGVAMPFQVLSTGVEITSQKVSKSYDDTVHGCTIEALEYPIGL